MKLYATTTSERASKGQGGNEYLQIEITVDTGIKEKIGEVVMFEVGDDIIVKFKPSPRNLNGKDDITLRTIKSKHKQDTPLEARQERDSEKIKQIIESLDKKGKQKKDETKASDICPKCGILYGDCDC
jgi:hypothetical protein